MPGDATTQTALMVMAIAMSIQTLVILVATVGAFIAWRRAQAALDLRYRELSARLEDTARSFREAAGAVSDVSQRASHAIDRAGQVASTAGAFVARPASLVTVGLAALVRFARGRSQKRAATLLTK